MTTLKTIALFSFTALFALYIGLEAGYRIGHNTAMQKIPARFGGLANGQ